MAKLPQEPAFINSKSTANSVLWKQATKACRQAAIEAYEDAQIRGLCAEGAFEAAMQAIENLNEPVPALRDDQPVSSSPDSLKDSLPDSQT